MSEIKLSETELQRLRDRINLSCGLWFAMDSNFPEVRVKNILEEVFNAGFKRGFGEAQSILEELGYEIKKKEG